MIAVAYLFVLQVLLAPAAAFGQAAVGAQGGPVWSQPLCDGDAGPAGDHPAHGLCCDLGCLPGSAGLAGPAVLGASPAFPPGPVPVPAQDRLVAAAATVTGHPPPGLPGARAPPASIA